MDRDNNRAKEFCLCFYGFSTEFWNCSDNVVYFAFHFINTVFTKILNNMVYMEIKSMGRKVLI